MSECKLSLNPILREGQTLIIKDKYYILKKIVKTGEYSSEFKVQEIKTT